MPNDLIQNIETEAETIAQPFLNLVKAEAVDVRDEFLVAMKQLPALIMEVLAAEVPTMITALPTLNAADIGAAAAASAISTLAAKGVPVLDSDLAALKGAALATAAAAFAAPAADVPVASTSPAETAS